MALNRLVIKYLRFTGLSTDIYISYAMKLPKLHMLKSDNIGPRGRFLVNRELSAILDAQLFPAFFSQMHEKGAQLFVELCGL
jgi:hypothetical protein